MNVNWERLWRSARIQFLLLFVIALRHLRQSAEGGCVGGKLVSFYDGDRTRILIATFIFGLAVLNLLWFRRGAHERVA